MSTNLIGDFTSGDELRVRSQLTVGGVPEPLAGSTIQLILVPMGVSAPAVTISRVVPVSTDATNGIYVLTPTTAEATVPPGRYKAYLRRIKAAGGRWTYHRETLQVFEAPP